MSKPCPYLMTNKKPCGEPQRYNSEYCLFHAKDAKAKRGAIITELPRIVNSSLEDENVNKIDFSGYRVFDFKFVNVVFTKELSLLNAYLEDVHFLGCTFKRDVDFSECIFTGDETRFIDCQFECKRTSFSSSHFKAEETSFIKCTFASETIFNKAVFEKATVFEGSRDSQSKLMFDGKIGFKYVTIRKPREFSFKHVKFNTVELRGTDLSELRFVAVQWNHTRSKLFHRENIILYDQICLEEAVRRKDSEVNHNSPEFNLLQTAYRELKQNFDNNRFFGPADGFYFREMEMFRCYPRTFRTRYLSWRFLYRMVAGYGLYWFNSFLSLTLTLLIFSTLVLFTGLDKPQIDYDLSFSFPPLWELLSDLGETLKYNLLSTLSPKEISTFYLPSICTRLIQVPEYILIVTFSTLTVLAIRRRFKR